MFIVCISVIALLRVAEGFSYNGEPGFLIDIPRENRNDSMCRNETVKEAEEDLREGDGTYCPGLIEFLDLMMDPTGETARDNFIETLLKKSVFGPVIDNFTKVNPFSDAERLLKNIWFKGDDSLFKRVFVSNQYGGLARTSSFGSYLYYSSLHLADVSYHSRGHKDCKNDTEVSIAACFYNTAPKSVVFIDKVNPLFDFTVFSLAAMMGKLIVNKTTQRNLTFVVQHPDDRDCLVPLTIVYKKYNNTPPIPLTYHNIKLIYYDYDGMDGKTNFEVCTPDKPGDEKEGEEEEEEKEEEGEDDFDDKEDYVEKDDDYDDEDTDTKIKRSLKGKGEDTDVDSSFAKEQVKKDEKNSQIVPKGNQ